MLRRVAVHILPMVILLIGFLIRVYQLDSQSLWWDEGHSIAMASAPIAQIAIQPGMDVHPPGYFLLLRFWMNIAGMREYALRYLSVCFSVLTVVLMMRFARTLSYAVAVGCGVFAALLPLHVAYAQEVRMYALVTCLAALGGYAQWRILFHVPSKRWWGTYILATAASLYTHYFALFIIAFQGLAWMIWMVAHKGAVLQRLWRVLLANLAVLILFIPQLPLALHQTTAYANPNLRPPSWDEFLVRSWRAYTIGLSIYPTWSYLEGVAALLTLAAIVLWVWRGGMRVMQWAYLASWFCIPLALYFLVLQRRSSFEPRYLITVMLALPIWWAGMILPVQQRVRQKTSGLSLSTPFASERTRLSARNARNMEITLRYVLAGALAIVLGLGLVSYFTNADAFKDDSAGVIEWLTARVTARDIVYVDVPHPFHYYAERIAAPIRYLFVDIHTAAATLNAEVPGREKLYWVTWRGSDTDPRGVIPFLLDKAARRIGDKDFRGYHVSWWQLPHDVCFSLPEQLAPVRIVFGDTVLVDGAAYGASGRAGEAIWATLHFALLRQTGVDYRASLRLRGADGKMLPPVDKDILNDRHLRTAAWPLNDARLNQALNVYTLPLPSDVSPGEYRLELVVYEATTLTPLTVVNGASSDDISASLGSIRVLR